MSHRSPAGSGRGGAASRSLTTPTPPLNSPQHSSHHKPFVMSPQLKWTLIVAAIVIAVIIVSAIPTFAVTAKHDDVVYAVASQVKANLTQIAHLYDLALQDGEADVARDHVREAQVMLRTLQHTMPLRFLNTTSGYDVEEMRVKLEALEKQKTQLRAAGGRRGGAFRGGSRGNEEEEAEDGLVADAARPPVRHWPAASRWPKAGDARAAGGF